MKILNAGAGSGKTSALSEEIKNRYLSKDNKAHIFVIAYSNYASMVIKDRLKTKLGEIPSEIHVSTIHSFMWNYIISPYNFVLFKEQFMEISTVKLSGDSRYNSGKLKRLREKGVLHISEFTRISRKILVGNKSALKGEKNKRNVILNHLSSFIDSIYIDEAQDMDKFTAECVKVLDGNNIPCILYGDKNQDLHSKKGFSQLIDEYPNDVRQNINNYRCPSEHVRISNRYIPYNQITIDTMEGRLAYELEKNMDIETLKRKNKDSLMFINRSIRKYQVHGNATGDITELEYFLRKNHALVEGYQDIRSEKSKKWAFDFSRRIEKYIYEHPENKNAAANKIIMALKCRYSNQLYAELMACLDDLIKSEEKEENIEVQSIEAVKGSQSDNCILLMSTDLFAVLIGEKKKINATTNALYVALTRSTNKLLIILTNEVEKKYSEEEIDAYMGEIGIRKYN